MNFSQLHTPPEFSLQGRGDVSNAALAVNTRKRSHKPTTTSSRAVQAVQYHTCLASHGRSVELPEAPAIKRRLISTPTATSGAVVSVADPPKQSAILSPEQQQEATSDTRLVTIIDYFPTVMRQRLQTFRDDQEIRAILASASVLLKILSARGINLSQRRKNPHDPTLFVLLDKCDLSTDLKLITEYFRKAAVFFSVVDTRSIKDTGCLTNMIHYKCHMQAFIKMSDADIQNISSSPQLKKLGCIRSGKGLPNVHNPVLETCHHHPAPENTDLNATLGASPPSRRSNLPDGHNLAPENTDLNETLDALPPSHREHLRKHPNDIYSRILLNDARILLDTLKQKNIPLALNKRQQPSAQLFDIIRDMDPVKDHQFISAVFRKAAVFFANVDPLFVKKTCHLSNMLKHRIHVEKFAAMKDADIAAIARHPMLVQISSHCRGDGLPDPERIRHITQFKQIKSMTNAQTVTKTAPQVDDRLDTVIGYFLLPHQADLQEYRHTEGIQLLLKSAVRMVDTLAKRKIKLSMNRCQPPVPSLFSLLRSFVVIDHYPLMTLYFNKVEVFFSAVDTSVIRDTSCFTNMIRLKTQIRSLVKATDDALRKLASSPYLVQRGQKAPQNLPAASEDAAPSDDSGVDDGKLSDAATLSLANSARGLPAPKGGKGCTGLKKLLGQEEILPLVTLMCYDQGITSADDVQGFFNQLQGQELSVLHTIANMCKGRGIPDARLISDFLTLESIRDEVTLGMLTIVCRAQGIPTANDVNNCLQWLPSKQIATFMRLLCRLFPSAGVPKLSALTEEEKALETIFCDNQPPEVSESLKDQFKLFALFCLNPNTWHLNREEFKDFLDTAHFSSRRLALDTMQSIVLNLGGPGVSLWLTKYRENCQHMDAVTTTLLMPAPLHTVRNALLLLPASQWLMYIESCKNLSPLPNQTQWASLQALMDKVDVNYPPGTANRKMLLEILWSLDDCWVYVSHIDSLLKTVPTVRQLHRVYCHFTKRRMKSFLDACLVWRPEKNNPPKLHEIESLMDGLLVAHYPIDCSWKVPGMCFSNISENKKNKSVTIDGTAAMTGNERLWIFVTAMLMELNRVGYGYSNNRLTLKFHKGKNFHLPKPKFTLTDSGFVIVNWSCQLLSAFFVATDFKECKSRPNVCEQLALEYRKKAVAADCLAAARIAATQPVTAQPVTAQTTTDRAATSRVTATRVVAAGAETTQTANSRAVTNQSVIARLAHLPAAVHQPQAAIPGTSEPESMANVSEDTSFNTFGYLMELPDFSLLEREFDFPEDLATSVTEMFSAEK